MGNLKPLGPALQFSFSSLNCSAFREAMIPVRRVLDLPVNCLHKNAQIKRSKHYRYSYRSIYRYGYRYRYMPTGMRIQMSMAWAKCSHVCAF